MLIYHGQLFTNIEICRYVLAGSSFNNITHTVLVTVKGKNTKNGIPQGVSYNHKNGTFLTEKVNEVFEPIPRLNCISEDDKNKQGSIAAAMSNWVGPAGQISIALCKAREVGIIEMKHFKTTRQVTNPVR